LPLADFENSVYDRDMEEKNKGGRPTKDDQRKAVTQLLKEGRLKPQEIANAVGVGLGIVYEIRRGLSA
jgi:hypothetical protein